MNYKEYQIRDIAISEVLDYLSGNTGLTAEFVYNAIPLKGKRYKILSSATQEENSLGDIPKCKIGGKELKVFEDKDGLLVIRKGKAGQTRYIQPGTYTLNDDAYILYVKEGCPYQIDLRWLSIQYRSDFLSYASSSDNGTWNMTGFFSDVKIDIPSYDEQKVVVSTYEKAEELIKSYQKKIDVIKELLSKDLTD